MLWMASCRNFCPIIPGHEIVGGSMPSAPKWRGVKLARKSAFPGLGRPAASAPVQPRENLCDRPVFTGYTQNGGYATRAIADARYAFRLSEDSSAAALAPLLCAGLIGWRSLSFAGNAKTLGLYGFGAAAHLSCKSRVNRSARFLPSRAPETRPRNPLPCASVPSGLRELQRESARASRRGDHLCACREMVPAALASVRKGGIVVCAGIHMSDIPSFPYRLLWQERQIVSVADLTRQDH